MALKSETSKSVNAASIGFSVKDILDLPATKKTNEDKRNNLDTENVSNKLIDFPAHLAGSAFFGQSLPASFYKYPADLLNLTGTFCKFQKY